jgi:hypothetical protein
MSQKCDTDVKTINWQMTNKQSTCISTSDRGQINKVHVLVPLTDDK